MIRSRTMQALVALVAVAALALTACGDDDDDDVSADADIDADAELDLDDVNELAFGDRDCREALTAYGAATAAAGSAISGQSDQLEDAADQLQALADDAPDEIKADLELFAEAYGEFVSVLVEAGWDPSRGGVPPQEVMDAIEEFSERAEADDFEGASARITTWFEENCST